MSHVTLLFLKNCNVNLEKLKPKLCQCVTRKFAVVLIILIENVPHFLQYHSMMLHTKESKCCLEEARQDQHYRCVLSRIVEIYICNGSAAVFPLRKFCIEQMFVLVRMQCATMLTRKQ